MSDPVETNKAQADFWASAPGRKWIEHESALDATLSRILDHLIEAAALRETDAVADIGCGTGASTLATARHVASGTVEGVDISRPMLERARQRALEARCDNVAFTLADAQTHAFAASHYDVVMSRMGMMFFDDPLAAFINLAQALKPGGRMVFIAWAGIGDNPWFHIPKAAAVARLGPAQPMDPAAPGPLAFHDFGRVVGLLEQAGLSDVRGKAVEVALTPPGTVEDGALLASRLGPAARLMNAYDANEDDARAIAAVIAEALRAFATGGKLMVPAVVNIFSASRGRGAADGSEC